MNTQTNPGLSIDSILAEAPKSALLDAAKTLDVHGRTGMDKLELVEALERPATIAVQMDLLLESIAVGSLPAEPVTVEVGTTAVTLSVEALAELAKDQNAAGRDEVIKQLFGALVDQVITDPRIKDKSPSHVNSKVAERLNRLGVLPRGKHHWTGQSITSFILP